MSSRGHRVWLAAVFVAWIAFAAANNAPARDREHDYDAPVPGSYALPPIKEAADGVLIGTDGKTVNLRELTRGRVTVLSFIYTRCSMPLGCPYASGVLGELQTVSIKDEILAKNLRLVSLSFDPEHDTPQRLAEYGESLREKKGCEWKFATARSRAELEPILQAYGQAVDPSANPADLQGPLSHVLRVFLIDRAGRIRNIYSSGTLDVRLVVADVKTLLLEEKKSSTK